MIRSSNYRLMREMSSNLRSQEVNRDVSYVILFSFFYKYASQTLKEYLRTVAIEKNTTLDAAYKDEELKEILKQYSFENFGYFIKSPEAFFDEVVYDRYSGGFFAGDLLMASKNLEFASKAGRNYFDMIYEPTQMAVDNIYRDNNKNRIVNEFVYLISKLSLEEEGVTYAKVFNIISTSRQINAGFTHEYLTNLLTEVVTADKNWGDDVYDPFSKDGSLLIDFSRKFALKNIYGKESKHINFITSLIRFFIEGFSWERVFLTNESANVSQMVESNQYDVIISKIPTRFNEFYHESYTAKSARVKADEVAEIKDMLLSKLSLNEDALNSNEMVDALNTIAEANIKSQGIIEFPPEYEILENSEFLFLIKLINSLKDDGVMAISISQNFLFKSSLATFRKYLTYEKNYIDAIISVPPDLGRAIRPDVIIVFKKNRNRDDILFIDSSNDYSTKKSPSAIPGTFRKNILLDDASLERIIDVYKNRNPVEKFSNLAGIKELEQNNFNLAISRYVDTFEGEFIRLEDLKNEKSEITQKIKKLNEKIDLMMDELDIRL